MKTAAVNLIPSPAVAGTLDPDTATRPMADSYPSFRILGDTLAIAAFLDSSGRRDSEDYPARMIRWVETSRARARRLLRR